MSYQFGDAGPRENNLSCLDRIRPPAETVSRMRSRFLEFGITRLARVTGLDCIGIPVWSAIRPNSKTLAVSQGKGIDDASAQASAAMEAVEVATAERADLAGRIGSAKELMAEGKDVKLFSGLLRANSAALEKDDVVNWIEGRDLLANATVWVPLEAVALSDANTQTRFWQSTDGLASGNNLWEAIVHGLCERIERDAVALWSLRDNPWVERHCCQPSQFEDPELSKLVSFIEKAELQLRLFDITSDVGVPVFMAVISSVPNGRESNWKHFDMSSGSGCHPNAVRAAIRAVTEAAQTRLTNISAIRDDFDPSEYNSKLNSDLLIFVRASPKSDATGALQPVIAPRDYIKFLTDRIRSAAVRSVVAVPLEANDPDFAVVKVLVPDLESPPGNRRFVHGRRALRVMLGGR
jgi:YcaO-like protein with predicted kinase domain